MEGRDIKVGDIKVQDVAVISIEATGSTGEVTDVHLDLLDNAKGLQIVIDVQVIEKETGAVQWVKGTLDGDTGILETGGGIEGGK